MGGSFVAMRRRMVLLLSLFTSCDSAASQEEVTQLRAELEAAQKELEELRVRPAELPSNSEGAKIEGEKLGSNEREPVDEAVEARTEESKAEEEKATGEDVKESPDLSSSELILAIKKLRPKKKVRVWEGAGEVGLKVTKARKGKKWIFDRTGYQYFLRDADKGSQMYSLDITVSSKGQNPELPSVEAWTVEEGQARRVCTFEWKFHRWDDYGSYLGNYHDSGNDFAKSDTVKFTVGHQLSDESLAGFLIVGVRKEKKGEFLRIYDNLGRPEIRYESRELMPGSAPLSFLVDGLEPLAVLNKKKLAVVEE